MSKLSDMYGPGPVPVNLTAYTPTGAANSMEGGPKDRKGRPLHTFGQHIADPVAHPYASVAGDWTLWAPYGQRIRLPDLGQPSEEWKALSGQQEYVFRVVDTGGHFVGAGKVYRHPGREPLDVCVTHGEQNGPIPPNARTSWSMQSTAELVEGDSDIRATGKLEDAIADVIGEEVYDAAVQGATRSPLVTLAVVVVGGYVIGKLMGWV